MHELAPGLSYWLAPHPDWRAGENWPREVPSFRFVSREGVVLIDPQLPPGGAAMFDDDPPTHVLLTAPWHARDTQRIVERHGASVWAPPGAVWKEPAPATTAAVPDGVEALLPDGDPNEALFYLPAQRSLITGDAFSATGGRFHAFIGDQEREPFVRWLPRLLDLPVCTSSAPAADRTV